MAEEIAGFDRELTEAGSGWWEKYKAPLYLGLGGIVLVALGVLLFSLKSEDEVKVQTIPVAEKSAEAGPITVDIEGAVEKPGLYELAAEARVNDLLIKAGGLAGTADRAWVQQNLNMAQKLTDGAKLWIPAKGESKILNGVSDTAGGATSSNLVSAGKININTASAAELDQLSGIGSVRAAAIVAGRPYANPEELVSKKIMPKSVFDKIKDKISVF
jgi:competence protein ComEA